MKRRIASVIILCITISSVYAFSSCNSDDSKENSTTKASVSSTVTSSDSEDGLGDDSTSEQMLNETVEYIDITVSESNYIYENKTIDFDELKMIILESDESQIRLTDDNASQKTYKELTVFLDENSIEYFNDNE